jgi:hypothetical protein
MRGLGRMGRIATLTEPCTGGGRELRMRTVNGLFVMKRGDVLLMRRGAQTAPGASHSLRMSDVQQEEAPGGSTPWCVRVGAARLGRLPARLGRASGWRVAARRPDHGHRGRLPGLRRAGYPARPPYGLGAGLADRRPGGGAGLGASASGAVGSRPAGSGPGPSGRRRSVRGRC